MKAHDAWISSLALADGGKLLATTSDTLKIWDAKTGSLLKELIPPDAVAGCSFTPDGKMIAAALVSYQPGEALRQGELRVWNLESGEEVMSHANETSRIFKVNWSRNGVILYSTGNGSLVAVPAPASVSPPTLAIEYRIGTVELAITGPTGAVVWVEHSTDLTTWEPWRQTVGTGQHAEKIAVPSPFTTAQRFFRVRNE